MSRSIRRATFVLAAVVALSGIAAGSLAAKPTLTITSPGRAFQGKATTVTVKSTSFGCKLSVRYSDGQKQADMLPTQVRSGKVTWQWQVPDFAAPGPARLTAACPGAGKATKTVIVVGGLIPPKVNVVKQGFSVRVNGNGENVSYGLVLQNTSPNANALGVTALVNFVMPDNHLIGTASNQVPVINAGSYYYLGGEIGFQGAPPIQRLEIVINPGGRAKTAKVFEPALDNVKMLPNDFDPNWLGYVQGDIINVHPKLALSSSPMSCVIFDSAGNVLGGGTGGANFTLQPGTRSFFKLSSGFDPIPYNKVASVSISIIPAYQSPTSP